MLDEVLEVLKELKTEIEKARETLRRDLLRIQTGRANAAMLDGIRVYYYGVPTPINQMATVSLPEPRLIAVKPLEKGQVKAIEKALRDSDLGFTPQIDGELIRIPIPALTEERRKEMVKLTKRYGEDGKVAIRRYLRNANEIIEQLNENGDIGEDAAAEARKKVEELGAEGTKQINDLVAAKERDILEV